MNGTAKRQTDQHQLKVTRPVAAAPRGETQELLFTELPLPMGSEAERPQRVKFKDPNPRGLWVGGKRLDDLLVSIGQGWVLNLRKLLRKQDWSAFEAMYKPGGRPPYAPAAMYGIVMYGILTGRGSLRGMERLARRDLGCWWISGGIMPDHSVIGRFLNNHKETIEGNFFESLTAKIVEDLSSEVSDLSGDGTTIQAVSSRWNVVKLEAAREARDKAVEELAKEPESPELQAAAEKAQEVLEVAEERAARRQRKGKDPKKTMVSPTEPEAYVQPLKNKSIAPSHKLMALANSDRLVLSYGVDSSCETQPLPEMLEQARRVNGGQVERIKLDSAFHGGGALKVCADQGTEVLCPSGPASNNYRKRHNGKFSKAEFRYEAEKDIYICPAGEELQREYAYAGNEHHKAYIRYGTPACADCPLRDQCTTSKKGRRIKRYDNDHLKQEARKAFFDPVNQEAYKRRSAEIEPVFGDLKGGFRFRRFRRWGLAGARLDAAIHLIAHNCKRALCIAFSRSKELLQSPTSLSNGRYLGPFLMALVHLWRGQGRRNQTILPIQMRSLRASMFLAAP